ncbi:DNA alkylation repair enzyme [hydrothermal vent metagenome]|uniref:DNA alkylation repair enzyme n=1 Tax=hydrothermal vent metagenome TaxID=652676 RepID=A0A1W1BWU8_9ZZZZ
MIEKKYLLKDKLYNPKKVKALALEIKSVYECFDVEGFEVEVLDAFDFLELKGRMYHIRDMLHKFLPCEYENALEIILKALPQPLDNALRDDDFGDFIYAPYGEFVTAYGCCEEYLEISLLALEKITLRFSVEFAIRDFINLYPKETLEMLERCVESSCYHQRRLASEGLRPKLPWAKKLTLDYKEALPLLEKLFDDKTRYVTRSVANHLNDISKIDASLVVATLKDWEESHKQESKEMTYMISHALRTLFILSPLRLEKDEIGLGEYLKFSFDLEAKKEMTLMIDYKLYFKMKNTKYSPKVFKLKKIKLAKGESLSLEKKHLFKAHSSTRKYYEGEHKMALQINGKVYDKVGFYLSSD